MLHVSVSNSRQLIWTEDIKIVGFTRERRPNMGKSRIFLEKSLFDKVASLSIGCIRRETGLTLVSLFPSGNRKSRICADFDPKTKSFLIQNPAKEGRIPSL